ncbi:MAG: hypothetical protein HKN25_05160 [Pyrinomonadaceae bacterium]|nr:hypothetical protein [Pyrinomonadaceae bacterium]
MKLRESLLIVVACFLLFHVISVRAQVGIVDRDAEEKPTFILLGTYHMGIEGNNVFKSDVDDITLPKRQEQIADLIDRLKKYKPTKIAIECDIKHNARIQKAYDAYQIGQYKLSKNETNQIGFRLAKELKHKKIFCVDWGIFPEDPLYNYQTYAEKDDELKEFLSEIYKKGKKKNDENNKRLRELSIADQLILLNQPDRIERSHQGYYDFMRIGRGEDYVGANYLSWWYGRNMKILMNIIRITDSPDDRILVIYGAGHNKLLTQFATESGFYKVESPLKYLQ